MVPDRISTPYRDDAYPVNARNYGAKGDGVTDDTAAIMVADADARAAGRSLILPAGTYLGSQMVLQTGSSWLGEGRDKTVLRQAVGANRDFIYGANSAANWGSSNPTSLVNGCRLEGLTIDGNWN